MQRQVSARTSDLKSKGYFIMANGSKNQERRSGPLLEFSLLRQELWQLFYAMNAFAKSNSI